MFIKTKIRFLLTAFFLSAIIFTTCETPMGMGKPIDWEPPVLTLDPIPSPFYVRLGSILTGTATDNVGVDKIIFINTATDEELFPVIRDGDNFTVELAFTPEQNGEKIVAQLIAYDKAGNVDPNTIVTLYVDIRPPVVEYIDIKRTDSRMASLRPFSELRALEGTDRKADLYKYQNGWFYINGIVSDEDTKVKIISLEFYDTREPNNLMHSQEIDEGYTPYLPRWTIKEEEIISAGAAKWGPDYETNYYQNKMRYYYRVSIKAIDMSENESGSFEEDEGYICLWADSDKPKGAIDPSIRGKEGEVATVSRGTPLPVDFYDDDSLLWAFTGLLTKDQWDGKANVYDGSVKIPEGTSDEFKLQWLKDRLTGTPGDSVAIGTKGNIYNWKYDKHLPQYSDKETIAEEIGTSKVDEKLVYVPTGNAELDYGDYVLFTLVADEKLDPHTKLGPKFTNTNTWSGSVERVQVIDENAPVIVFDTANECPEENTFPALLALGGSEEKYFVIRGYTLRENSAGINRVTNFRMAWIPYGMPGGADSHISSVQAALRNNDFSGMPAGVQYWDFPESSSLATPLDGRFIDRGDDTIDGNKYKKQSFEIRFSVMGDSNFVKPVYRDFTYNTNHENETKLFIFYVVDTMGHEVYRQLRLLGYRDEPELVIYDITNRIPRADMPDQADMPNLSQTDNIILATGGPTPLYYSRLDAYNMYSSKPAVYNKIRTAAIGAPGLDEDKIQTSPFQMYPRETVLKYYVEAKNKGKIPIDTITMQDITFEGNSGPEVGSRYQAGDKAITFCEYYPDVTQRTFLFTAKDRLGNTKRIQRTIAVTNAARLERITTTTQSGTYGIGTKIILRAEFSGQIYIGNGLSPKLYVRYLKGGVREYQGLTCKSLPTLSNPATALEFEFEVPENATGTLETMYELLSDSGGAPDKHPLTLGSSTVLDQNRKDSAFIPGETSNGVTMPNWQDNSNTLQSKKTIVLDGVRPRILTSDAGVVWGGKTAYSGTDRYFKIGEAITVTLEADKDISPSGASTLQYYIKGFNGASNGPYNANNGYAEFKYLRPGTTKKQLVYSLTVSAANCPYDGQLEKISLFTGNGGNIVDDVDNAIASDTVNETRLSPTTNFYIKKAVPAAPAVTLSNVPANLTNVALATAPPYYNGTVNLSIANSAAAAWADWEDTKQYSTNGGVTWTDGAAAAVSTAGVYNLQFRYKDRAGNEGSVISKTIDINNTFPALRSVNITQANGYYRQGGNLTINLNFADTVTVTNRTNVTIKLKNRSTSIVSPTNEKDLTTNMTNGTSSSTITFTWAIESGKEMREGLYISDALLTGLSDKYGIAGGGPYTAAFSGGAPAAIASCTNLAAGVMVDSVAPTVSTRVPENGSSPTGDALVNSIVINFSEPVMKGSGMITIRPKSGYAIPPVLKDTGYYVGYTNNGLATGTTSPDGSGIAVEFSSSGTNRTYISSFNEIYNAIPAAPVGTTQAVLRGYLTAGSSMLNLDTNARTGQSAGPYKKMTHGLVEGLGYSGNYYGTDITSGINAPSVGGTGAYTAMIPDTATKWVLDYKYGITQNIAAVNNIRTALTHAKWRWQEIDVVSTTITNTTTSGTVTIPLNEPLLKGLDWEVYYPATAFTDLAGNSAPGSGTTNTNPTLWTNTTYTFTSPGVQAPVIRVNRRSSDSRNVDWNQQGTYAEVTPTTGWNSNTIEVTDSNGWGITNFNNIHFRVESESLGAAVSAQTIQAAANQNSRGAAKGAWENNVWDVNYTPDAVSGFTYANRAWSYDTSTVGTWILPNMIRRTGNSARTYTVTTKNGTPEARTSVGALRMYKSYNRDLTAAQLGYPSGSVSAAGYTIAAASLSDGSANAATKGQGFITFTDYEASKSYIVGTASRNSIDRKGVEGVYRTVIMLNHTNTDHLTTTNTSAGYRYIAIEGSNIKNGMPSIAGFPVRDADESDCRYLKVCYSVSTTRFYWVSTEIVCEWYFLSWGRAFRTATPPGNGSHQTTGEVNNYQMVGYGDLTYAYDARRSGD